MPRSSGILLALLLTGPACHTVIRVRQPIRVGNTVDGLQSGPWRYYYDIEGRRDGMWARGDFHEDRPDGRWTFFHPRTPEQRAAGADGAAHWKVGFEDEAFSGPTKFYHPNGQVLAKGAFEDGRETGRWSFYASDGTKVLEGSFSRGVRSGWWKAWDTHGQPVAEGERRGAERIGPWRFWLPDGESFEVDYSDPDGSGPQASEELLKRLDARPTIPVQPLPYRTMLEERLSESLVLRYTEGVVDEETLESIPGYEAAKRGEKVLRDSRRSERLIGRALPRRWLKDSRGNNRDLLEAAARGRCMVLVILRGMTDEVCIYCMAQTESLALKRRDFEARGVDVVVVYPGDLARLDAFRSLYEREFRSDPQLPFLYDDDYSLVERLGIEGEFAKPTTLIVDEEGIIRWAYVGNWDDARPAAREILTALDEL